VLADQVDATGGARDNVGVNTELVAEEGADLVGAVGDSGVRGPSPPLEVDC